MNFMSLLQSAVGGDPDIEVVGRRPTLPPVADPGISPARPPLPPLTDNRAAPQQDVLKELIPRQGMFGTKGTLRDILGTLGDAFLVQSGNKAIYQPQRQQEKMGSAMVEFSKDPMAAAERLAAQGFPEQAQAVLEYAGNQQLKKAQMQSLADTRDSQVATRKEKLINDLGNYSARMIAKVRTPEELAIAKDAIQNRLLRAGIDPVDLYGPEGMDALTLESAPVFGRGDMTVNQQENTELGRGRLDVSRGQLDVAERNAASSETRAKASMINAQKPRAAPRAPQPTAASIAAPLLDKVARGGKLSPGEQNVLKRLGMSEDRGSGRKGRRAIGAPPAAILQRLGIPGGGQVRKIN